MKTVVGPDVERGIGDHKLLYNCIITMSWVVQAGFGLGEESDWGRVAACHRNFGNMRRR